MMNHPPELTMVDLFAGCGGLSLSMEDAGFTPVFVSELNADAMSTYLANRHQVVGGKPFADQANLRCNDAHDLRGQRLEELAGDLHALGLQIPRRLALIRHQIRPSLSALRFNVLR